MPRGHDELSVRYAFLWGYGFAATPFIVRDESSQVFLGGALQQFASASPTSSMVVQISVEVNRKRRNSLSLGLVVVVVKTGKNAGVLFRH